MVEKLSVILKGLKEHDSTLFQSNGLALNQGETCPQIKYKTDQMCGS